MDFLPSTDRFAAAAAATARLSPGDAARCEMKSPATPWRAQPGGGAGAAACAGAAPPPALRGASCGRRHDNHLQCPGCKMNQEAMAMNMSKSSHA